MKYLILFLILFIIGCNKSQINPVQVVETPKVTIILELTRDYNTEVYSNGRFVALLMEVGEIDTVLVEENALLKAQIHYPNNIGYKTEIAKDSLVWELP